MIYAINKRTKEHRVVGGVYRFGNHWDRVQADADGWIEWDQEGSPLPEDSRCDVRLGAQTVPNVVAHRNAAWEGVTHYRPILDANPEAPEWDGEGESPPVGSVCLKGCMKVKILAHTDVGSPYDPAVVWQSLDDPLEIDWAVANVFAPIRSESGRLIDEALDVLEADGDDKRTIYSTVARMIYHGYRKP